MSRESLANPLRKSSIWSTSSMDQRLRIAVIGAQTADPEGPKPYTVYRTVVTFNGECYERLIRYSEFYWFYKKAKFRKATPVDTKFPSKKWTRKSSLEDDVIESRQVLLNEFMKRVARQELPPKTEDFLMRLLKIAKYEHGRGRVSDLTSYKDPKTGQNNRTGLEAVKEEDEDAEADRKSTVALARAATLAASSLEFPEMTSNESIVLPEDDEEELDSRPQLLTDSEDEQFEEPNDRVPSAPESTSSLPEADAELENLSTSVEVETSPPAQWPPVNGDAPPIRKSFPKEPVESEPQDEEIAYSDRVSAQLNMINRLLYEKATVETTEDSSIQTQRSFPLTA